MLYVNFGKLRYELVYDSRAAVRSEVAEASLWPARDFRPAVLVVPSCLMRDEYDAAYALEKCSAGNADWTPPERH